MSHLGTLLLCAFVILFRVICHRSESSLCAPVISHQLCCVVIMTCCVPCPVINTVWGTFLIKHFETTNDWLFCIIPNLSLEHQVCFPFFLRMNNFHNGVGWWSLQCTCWDFGGSDVHLVAKGILEVTWNILFWVGARRRRHFLCKWAH